MKDIKYLNFLKFNLGDKGYINHGGPKKNQTRIKASYRSRS